MKNQKPNYNRIAELLAVYKELDRHEGNDVATAKKLPVLKELHDLTKDLRWDEEEVVNRAQAIMRERNPKQKRKDHVDEGE